jgi:NTE family protein
MSETDSESRKRKGIWTPDVVEDGGKKIAVACQGGGSHTAFTAGVLKRLLEDWSSEHRLVGLSGSSGGAFNAVAAWYGLAAGDRTDAVENLVGIWDDLSADGLVDRMTNDMMVGYSQIEDSGVPTPSVSPYYVPGSSLGQEKIKRTLRRYIEFDDIPNYCEGAFPELVVGTVNVNAGEFETFKNEDVTPEAVLASAADPSLFEGVEIHGHVHWDGLFSQNPPVNDLMRVEPERKPDEIWVVQINPQEREGEPKTLEEITDRRNELSGNISMNQELRFIERVNDWVDEGYLPEEDFTKTEVRRIEMGENYHCSTKLDRSPDFIDELMELGEKRAGEFLDD